MLSLKTPVLVVDDSDVFRTMLRQILRQMGFIFIWEAKNGKEALQAMVPAPEIGLLVTDHFMPEMTGLDLVRALRMTALHKDTPIIMVSGETGAAFAQVALEAGADHFLSKPFSPAELQAKVGLFLRAPAP